MNTAAPQMLLLGTGGVGQAVLQRHARLRAQGLSLPPLAWLGNARGLVPAIHDPAAALARALALPREGGIAGHRLAAARLRAGDVLVDASDSDAAACHPDWLSAGIHVVTANKLGAGGPLARQQAVVRAQLAGGASYGDAATVGAGLPLLRSLRALAAGGDRIEAIEGVLSGSWAWLLDADGADQAFSERVRQAVLAGYTEPDPRLDLSGEDVRRKLLILVRSAGVALQADQVRMLSLLPGTLQQCTAAQVDGLLWQLDAPLAQARQRATASAGSLAVVARWSASAGASIGLEVLPPGHRLSGGQGTDNRVLIHSERYRGQPLGIQGPGAGTGVTAAALLDDVLAIAAGRRAVTAPGTASAVAAG